MKRHQFMLYLDTIFLVSYKLQKFKKSNKTYNFRCPIAAIPRRTRIEQGGISSEKRSYYKCHNCGVGRSLANFLKDNDTALFSEYVLEAYKEGAR